MGAAKITLFSFAKYMNDIDDDLFSRMTLPSGIDKDVLTDNILLRGGEFEVIYSDPFFLQKSIRIWSSKWYRTFEKWVNALNIDYSPLENYDRIETFKDIVDKDSNNLRTLNNEDKRTLDNEDKRTLDNEDKRTNDHIDTQTHSALNKTVNDDTNLQKHNNNNKTTNDAQDKRTLDTETISETTVSAFDSSSYQPSNKVVTNEDGTITDDHTGTIMENQTGVTADEHKGVTTDTGSGILKDSHTGTITDNHTGTVTDNHTGTVTDNHTGTIKDALKDDTVTTHYGRTHGNIGVTTSQQLLESELEIAKWNLYEHITDIFLEEFIIPIYT